MLKSLLESSSSHDGKARYFAVENTVELTNLIPPTVSYNSTGHLVVIGPISILKDLAPQLTEMATVTLLCTDNELSLPHSDVSNKEETSERLYFAKRIHVTGFLGTFQVSVDVNGAMANLAQVAIGKDCFDLVLDMTLTSHMSEEVPVPGYYPVGRGYPKLAEALVEIPTLMGTFDKPKFFRLDTDKCAHSSRGVKGCDRCVDACPAGALTSDGNEDIGHKIQINPYLCQGVGTCATACPTEAISYALPEPEQTQKFIENLLANYKKAGGVNPIILFCSERHETYNVMALKALPDNVIPVELEDLPSVGIDTWFAALTNGACQVMFAASQHMPETIKRVLGQEVEVAKQLLTQLGVEPNRIDILFLESMRHGLPELIETPLDLLLGPLQGSKRQRLFTALDNLAAVYPPRQMETTVSASAPFGKVNCDETSCTLCMGCVAVCPTAALHNDGISPKLQFIEQDCIQCGMCEKACPENSLTLSSQFNWDQETRQSAQIIHEEKAAECLSCGKPFAPQSMITMLQDKLRGHSHFADDTALSRIAMCEDCRVIDMFSTLADNPEKQLDI
ncbi:4Fe-4S dicluster domain-containing protein [Vibrio tapetis subsp. quintayensis]|uniref:4Fe-4S dicluster domain-containing protein n=1 Tax=Vibrio tapetis TaxID=52443 RepID=UPI0025B59D2A|nr:4Fe-4S dicluster domain-containing protein [Vibrio tapetis]MDN3679155.1 4Fe-4S dicluster domain-containing protein [Vibrio tapetis subsp. quintayensis]